MRTLNSVVAPWSGGVSAWIPGVAGGIVLMAGNPYIGFELAFGGLILILTILGHRSENLNKKRVRREISLELRAELAEIRLSCYKGRSAEACDRLNDLLDLRGL